MKEYTWCASTVGGLGMHAKDKCPEKKNVAEGTHVNKEDVDGAKPAEESSMGGDHQNENPSGDYGPWMMVERKHRR